MQIIFLLLYCTIFNLLCFYCTVKLFQFIKLQYVFSITREMFSSNSMAQHLCHQINHLVERCRNVWSYQMFEHTGYFFLRECTKIYKLTTEGLIAIFFRSSCKGIKISHLFCIIFILYSTSFDNQKYCKHHDSQIIKAAKLRKWE